MKTISTICPLLILVILRIYPTDGADGKVIDGVPVNPPHKYPFIVSMQKGDKEHTCAGTIWDKYWIVTAAHCVTDPATGKPWSSAELATLKWVTGLHKRSQPDPWAQTVNTAGVLVHPIYTKDVVFGDIALVRVSPPIIFNKNVTLANYIPFDFDNYTTVNYTATLAGWGKTGADSGSQLADELMEVELPVYTLESCQRYLSNYQKPGDTSANYSAAFTEDHICAGKEEGGSGVCLGDSGGPLMVYDNTTLTWTQIGIVNWVAGCGAPRAPNVFTRVNRYYRWLSQMTRSCVDRNK